VNICSNGFLSLTSRDAPYFTLPLPNPNTPNAMIAPFWQDLNPYRGGKITYGDFGDKFVVSWEDVPFYSPRNKKVSFQVILKVDGSIIYQYKQLDQINGWVRTRCGIEDEVGRKGEEYDQSLLANHKAYEIKMVVKRLESPPVEEVQIIEKISYIHANGQLVAKLTETQHPTPKSTTTTMTT
jgi:cellobiose-specific phosphotransferase system component IIB